MNLGCKDARGVSGRRIALKNRAAVRAFLKAHLGATKTDVAKGLGLSVMAAGRHVRAIRAEWAQDDEVVS